MADDSSRPTIVVCHDAETLYERGAVVTCGKAFVEVVGQHEVRIDNPDAATRSAADDADAPVEVGRIAVAKVIKFLTSQVGTDIERLMADAHTIEECLGCEFLGRCESAATQEVSLVINQMCIAIENGRMS